MPSKILVIEDEETWREQFTDILITCYEVDTAEGETAAKKLLEKYDYDLILHDITLDQPNFAFDCQKFCNYLRGQYPKIKIVAVTGKPLEPPEMWTLFQLGVDDFLYKPKIQLTEFRNTIQNILQKPPPDKNSYKYDVFISYSHQDKKWVRNNLLPKLEKVGIRVCIDYRDFKPGAFIIKEIERSVISSYKTLLIITPDYLASKWTEMENILIFTRDPSLMQRPMIPILLKQCELPPRLRALIYLDFTNPKSRKIPFSRLMADFCGEN